MSARETILKNIKAAKPEPVQLPVIDLAEVIAYDNLLQQFITTLEGIGGKVVPVKSRDDLASLISQQKQKENYVVDLLDGGMDEINKLSSQDLAPVDLAIIKGVLGVAENGSIWVSELQMKNRVLPFICQHLALVIEEKNIVPTMHHAYEKIKADEDGFGVFIAGPSKTADIEQSLVIGAHGARSLVAYVIMV